MKNSLTSLPALLAVTLAAASLPLGVATATLVLTTAGILAIVAADYGRTLDPLRPQAQVIPLGRPAAPALRAAA